MEANSQPEKRFAEWIKLKQKLHENTHNPPVFEEGEVWWCSVGENIGTEINGKSVLFTRPVFIYKKLSSVNFLGLSLTSQERNGIWYVPIYFSQRKNTVVMSQVRMFDYKRLSSKMGKFTEAQKIEIKKRFILLYG